MRTSIWFTGLLMALLCGAWSSHAQLEVRSIYHGSESSAFTTQARVIADRDTLVLPFWDDFSSSTTLSTKRWLENTGVLVNGTQGKSSPTLNVASFDGTDLYGNPQNAGGVNSETTDMLVSQPIDLAAIPDDKKDSVWFSFYWQMGGWGEVPEHRDSLKVEFLDKDSLWNVAFEIIGITDSLFDTFKRYPIHINDEKYFHSGFQFRFRASGNSLGPYDSWHIDNVYLNTQRYRDNEFIGDRAIASTPTSIFSQYTMIPYDVLFDFPDTIYKPVEVDISYFDKGEYFPNFVVNVRDTLSGTNIGDQPKESGSPVKSNQRATLTTAPVSKVELQAPALDSLFLEFELVIGTIDDYLIAEINGDDITYVVDDSYNYRLNDTVRSYHEVHHTLAYDDGSAEYAAGLNKNESLLGVYFNIPSEDTLTSVDIYFPQFSRPPADAISPSGKRFILYVMSDSLGFPGPVRRAQEFVVPGGAGLNQFNRFTFDIPVVLSGKFHIAFQQLVNEYIGIGLDNNNLIGEQKITVKTDDEIGWQVNAKVEGMVMLRAIFEDSHYVVSAIENEIKPLNIFPNPANDRLTIQGDFDQYELLNLSGKMMRSGRTNELNLSDLQNGIYFLKVRSGKSFETRKVIVQH